jgi:hypothetical protein
MSFSILVLVCHVVEVALQPAERPPAVHYYFAQTMVSPVIPQIHENGSYRALVSDPALLAACNVSLESRLVAVHSAQMKTSTTFQQPELISGVLTWPE